MKTTVEISDALLEAARRAAAERGTTVRALIETGLRHVLQPPAKSRPFKLRDASFGSGGLTKEAKTSSWETLRELSYGERMGPSK